MKYIGENAIKKLISLIKGDLATKQPTITASGLLKGDGAGTVTAADTQEATLVDVPNGLLKGNGTTISAAVAETDYMVPPTGGITGQVLKKTETGTEWADASFKPEGNSYLTFSSTNSFTLKVNDTTKHWNGTLEYFSSNRTWTTWDGTITLSSVDNDGENVLYLRGTGNTVITGNDQNYSWILTGSNIACIGNIENLLDYSTVESGNHPTMADYCYAYMFSGCTSLTQAPALPATTLTRECYGNMFSGCTSLTKVHSLPATTLTEFCYFYMFSGCTSLTQAPALPTTTLANYCYSYMFKGCTSLTQAPALPATTLANYCYSHMFRDCTALTQAPALPVTTLANSCYQSMFYGCTSLTQAPALPATTLASWCYFSMFYGCTSLKLSSSKTGEYTQEYRIPSSDTGTTATNALNNMFTSTGGTFTGTPEINTTYYLSSDNMIVRETEIATLNGYVGAIAAPASHVEDTTVHVTADEKSAWNESILIGESLIELPNPHSRSLDVTYGDNKFVAVMYSSNKAIYSLDGFIWHETTLPGSLQWHAVTYGNGKFVAIASNSTIAAYSADGITWNQTSLPSGGYWWDVTYGNGKFVTIKANSNTAAYSNDGITWTEITLPVSKFWYTITYGNNRFVVLPDGSDVAIYSDDGMTWTETTLPVSKSWSGVSYGDDKFVAVSTNSNIAIYSSDGVTWTETTLPVSNYWEPIIYGGDKFVATAFNNNGNIAIYSYNGIEWSDTTMPAVQNWKSLAYGKDKFVALSDTTMAAYSLDGITWSNTKPSLQTVSGTDVTDDTKVILGISDKQDKLPVDVEILETICENIEITKANNTYTFPTAITIDSDGLYYINYSYYKNDTFDLLNSGYLFSKPETIDDVLSVRWLSSSATNSITMTAANIVDTWVGTSAKSIISIYKVNVTVNDEMKKAALLQEGTINTAIGNYSHTEGSRNTASGVYSHAEGTKNTASGFQSHAEGRQNTASGSNSHAEGDTNTASGVSSHVEGFTNTASGVCSHAEGCCTEAFGYATHVQGRYNIIQSDIRADVYGPYCHIVGNGLSDTKRSNAHTLDWNGNAWFAGTLEGTALILKSSTSNSTKRFKITVDDSGNLTATAII